MDFRMRWTLPRIVLTVLFGLACQPAETAAPRNVPPQSAPAETAEPPEASTATVATVAAERPEVPVVRVPRGKPKPEGEMGSIRSFSVTVLSRGKGVPAEAREALAEVRKVVEADRSRGVKVTMTTDRIGIEGESRLCVEYENGRDGSRAYQRAGEIVKGVDLVNLDAGECEEKSSRTGIVKKEKE